MSVETIARSGRCRTVTAMITNTHPDALLLTPLMSPSHRTNRGRYVDATPAVRSGTRRRSTHDASPPNASGAANHAVTSPIGKMSTSAATYVARTNGIASRACQSR
jgi:hypothetical protein